MAAGECALFYSCGFVGLVLIVTKMELEHIAFFANKEGLGAHAKSATVRFEDEK